MHRNVNYRAKGLSVFVESDMKDLIIANRGILQENVKEFIEFTIENSGSEVEERHLERLFDRFFQVNIHDANEGSGVGLNLAKMLVDLHHGDIRAYNTEKGK